MTIVQVTASPFEADYEEDNEFPWTYDEDGFVSWVYEILMDGCSVSPEEMPEVPISLDEAVEHAESMGYELVVKPKLA